MIPRAYLSNFLHSIKFPLDEFRPTIGGQGFPIKGEKREESERLNEFLDRPSIFYEKRSIR